LVNAQESAMFKRFGRAWQILLAAFFLGILLLGLFVLVRLLAAWIPWAALG